MISASRKTDDSPSGNNEAVVLRLKVMSLYLCVLILQTFIKIVKGKIVYFFGSKKYKTLHIYMANPNIRNKSTAKCRQSFSRDLF